MTTSLLVLLATACGDGAPVPAPLALRAPDDSGVLVLVQDRTALVDAMDEQRSGARLQWQEPDGSWYTAVGPSGQGLAGGSRYWLAADNFGDADLSTLKLRLVVGSERSAEVETRRAALDLELTAADPPLVATDAVGLSLVASLGDLNGGSGAVEVELLQRQAQADTRGWLDLESCPEGAALSACLVDEPAVLPVAELSELPALPGIALQHDQPAAIEFTARLWLDAVAPDGSPTRGLLAQATPSEPIYSVGRTLYWGDLHAHSNLSHDGCEVPEDGCDHRGEAAGEDFFDNARANGLDYVAITDHAEWERYYPDGLTAGTWVDIWSEQQRLAAEADADDLVALVGYEWTNKRDKPSDSEAEAFYAQPYEGGHKTVVFQELDIDEDFRIGATEEVEVTTKGGISAYTVGDNPQTDVPAELYDLLDDAAARHGSTPVMSFFHHSAIEKPQGADFDNPVSQIDTRYERLIEIYSEHGISECIDPQDDDCGWQVNDENYLYLPRGSVQYALSHGWRLGFTSGTDCHDARPGSLDDGPSYHGNPGQPEDTPLNLQYAPGGLTGAWVAGPLDRVGLFQALFDRATVATSGPRPAGRVLAIDADGVPWLPGSVLPAGGQQLRVLARVNVDGYTTDRIALVAADGQVLHTGTGAALDYSFQPDPDWAYYLRVVMTDTATAQEARLWISPFFTESE